MDEQKNNQEQLEEIQETPVSEEAAPEETIAEAVAEEMPAEAAEENPAEETAAEVPAEPVKKATPGKIALAIGAVVVLAAVLIALIVSGGNQDKAEEPTTETAAVAETVEATIPADGNPEDVTCKGSYSVSDEEIAKRKSEMPLKKKEVSGYLKRYAEQVSSADKGAIINK